MVVVGLLWPWLSKLGLGRLADDIAIERGNVTFYFLVGFRRIGMFRAGSGTLDYWESEPEAG